MPGKKLASIKGGKAGAKQYEAIKRAGASKQVAAATVNKRFGKGRAGGRKH
jgi:hypothetical protein